MSYVGASTTGRSDAAAVPTGGKITHRDVPCASSLPRASSIDTCDSASERPAWMSVPRAVSTPLEGEAGRRKFIESSAVVYGVAGGSVVWIAHPSGPSASTARTPPWISPGGDINHGEAGIVNVVSPGPTSTGSIPVR